MKRHHNPKQNGSVVGTTPAGWAVRSGEARPRVTDHALFTITKRDGHIVEAERFMAGRYLPGNRRIRVPAATFGLD